MNKAELARKLAEMTRAMEEAKALRNRSFKKVYHRTNGKSWKALKRKLNYTEPEDEFE